MNDSAKLSPQEDRVFALLAGGLSNKEIAHRLEVGMGSVAQLKARVKTKLRVRSSIQLALLWHGCDPNEAIVFAEQLRPAGRVQSEEISHV